MRRAALAGNSEPTAGGVGNLDIRRVVEEFLEASAEAGTAVGPPGLYTRATEEPQDVGAMPDPEIVIDPARLVLEKQVLEASEQAQLQMAELRPFILRQ